VSGLSNRHLAGPPRRRVLVTDDDPDIRILLTDMLARADLDVTTAATGAEALRQTFAHRPDLVVLDLGLPDIDGLEVIRRLRELTDVPILVLTARGLEHDKVQGLVRGADDYVTKPFSNAELVARVQALLRRTRADDEPMETLGDGGLVVDLRQHTVHSDGASVSLSPIEWNLLVTFLRHPGQLLSPDQLLEHAWADPTGVGPERVKFAVLRLRRRLGWQDPATSPIEAVRGFGYRYRGTESR
jgi:DNA-binding response OmpR family regulator